MVARFVACLRGVFAFPLYVRQETAAIEFALGSRRPRRYHYYTSMGEPLQAFPRPAQLRYVKKHGLTQT